MKKDVSNKNGKLQVKNKIESNKFLKAAAFKKAIRKTTPHKHDNYFEIIFLSKGSGFHYIDNFQYKVTPPILFFVRKEQVHYWELESEPEGFVLIIKKSFIENSIDKELMSLFASISRLSSIQLKYSSTIEKLLELLTEENLTLTENNYNITEGLLKALLAKILELSHPPLKSIIPKSDLYHALLNLLNSGKPLQNKVAFYANLLNTSPQNLNAVCRKMANQSATEVISEFILSEAKRLLIYTSKTINEVAYELNFSDASHFVKYFKKAVGQTPMKFRQNG